METFPTRLSVNVNKVATLRNARGGTVPCPVEAARRIQEWGADGITVHPRPDARHITYDDVRALRPVVHTVFNIEGYPSEDFVELVLEVRPLQVQQAAGTVWPHRSDRQVDLAVGVDLKALHRVQLWIGSLIVRVVPSFEGSSNPSFERRRFASHGTYLKSGWCERAFHLAVLRALQPTLRPRQG